VHEHPDEQQRAHAEEDPEEEHPPRAERPHQLFHPARRREIAGADAEGDQDRQDDQDDRADGDADHDHHLGDPQRGDLPVGDGVVEPAAEKVEDAALHNVFRR
jgi:hypothetical protein